MTKPMSVATCLWFEKDGMEAAKFYVSLIPGSTLHSDPDGPQQFMVGFDLGGTPYTILNGGPMFKQSEAVSIFVTTPDQDETDRLWEALTADGGAPGRCGWLKDRWGVSWQIIPEALGRLAGHPDREGAGRAMQAMRGMGKIDVAGLEAAFRGE